MQFAIFSLAPATEFVAAYDTHDEAVAAIHSGEAPCLDQDWVAIIPCSFLALSENIKVGTSPEPTEQEKESAAYLTVGWDNGEPIINGPYDSFATAEHIILEDIGEGEQGGIIGPVPFKRVVVDGERAS